MWAPMRLDVPCVSASSLLCCCQSAKHLTFRVPHEILPCLSPCSKTLSCGHKCSGVCTDKCHCAEDCRDFHLRQSDQRMAKLQLGDGPWDASQSELPSFNSSPEKWQQFSRDPGVHDNAIRQARLQQLAEQDVQARPVIDLSTHSETKHGASGDKAPGRHP